MLALHLNVALVLLDDVVADSESETKPLTLRHRGKERIEDPGQVLRGNAITGIANPYLYLFWFSSPSSYCQRSTVGHGVAGVDDQVGEDLLQKFKVAIDLGWAGLELFPQRNFLRCHLGGELDNSVFQYRVQIDVSHLHGL